MKRLKRKACLVGMVALVIGLLIVPNVSAYYWTQNPPGPGYHGNPPNPPGVAACDGSSSAQILDWVGTAYADIVTGGDPPEDVAIQGGRLVFFVSYHLAVGLSIDPPVIDYVEAQINLVLSLEINNQWCAQDTDMVFLIAHTDESYWEDGYLYVYEHDRQYQAGDKLCLTLQSTVWYYHYGHIDIVDNAIEFSYYNLT